MKVLIVGSGGREHALAWMMKKSGADVFVAPGNGGTSLIARNVDIQSHEIEKLAEFARDEGIDLTIAGPELPISLGLYDEFSSRGLKVLAPSRDASRLEASKIYAKNFMRRYGIPTADFETFDDFESARRYVEEKKKFPIVIKADGLAAGKGVVIAKSVDSALYTLKSFMIEGKFGDASKRIVIEEFLEGQEFSIFVLTDGENYVFIGGACDYKRLFDGDWGPNTGGMGSVAPVPFLDDVKLKRVEEEIIKPTLMGIRAEHLDYRGFLYFGLIWTGKGPMVLEYNVRLGDPETQAILPIFEGDFLELIVKTVDRDLKTSQVTEPRKKAVTVIAASLGYPFNYQKGKEITGISEEMLVFHAGTKYENGKFYTSGGRVLGVTGTGRSFEEAIKNAYDGIERIDFEGIYYRRDIGEKWTRKILIIAGSESDEEFVRSGLDILDRLSIPYEFRIISAHRNLPELMDYIKSIKGFEVIIAVAGLAAHLPGVIAGLTDLPVIGVPRDTGPLNGQDALYSMVQMPRGVPVATMAIGKHGMINAILLALRILSTRYPWAGEALKRWKK